MNDPKLRTVLRVEFNFAKNEFQNCNNSESRAEKRQRLAKFSSSSSYGSPYVQSDFHFLNRRAEKTRKLVANARSNYRVQGGKLASVVRFQP